MIVQGLDQVDHPQLDALRARCEIVLTHKDDRAGWLALRRHGLGGSDVGAALGISPYTSPTKLWLEKTGQIPEEDLSSKEQVYWGNRLEHIVAEDFATSTGYTVIETAPPDYNATFIRRDRPTQVVNPDRLYIDHDGNLGVLECKTGDWRTSEHWSGEASPPWYEAQDGWYGDTLGLLHSRIAALLGGNRFIVRDPKFTAEQLRRLGDFGTAWWERHVVGGEPPTIDGSKATTTALNQRWEVVGGQSELDNLDIDLVRAFVEARDAEKAAKAEKDRLGNLLRDRLADYAEGTRDGVVIYSNKPIPRSTVDWETVARKAARLLDIDVEDLIEDHDRSEGSSRRLYISTARPAKAILQGAA